MISFGLTYFDSRENNFAAIAFWGSLFLTAAGFFLFRRKTRKWKVEQDAASWMANRSWRQLHPQRARYLRIVFRCLLILPSILAALVVFFLPVATHVAFLGTNLMPHDRFSVPLNWTVIRSCCDYPFVWTVFSGKGAARYGLTPLWFTHSLPSGATFAISDPASRYAWSRPEMELASGHSTHTAKLEFTIGTMAVDCWEYRTNYDDATATSSSLLTSSFLWEVLCSTQPNGRDFNLHASFLGHREDVPAFYEVLKRAAPSP